MAKLLWSRKPLIEIDLALKTKTQLDEQFKL